MRTNDGGIGYPGRSGYCDLVHFGHDNASGPVVTDAAAMEIEYIVCAIKQESPERFAVVQWFYLRGNHTIERTCAELHCSKQTAYNRLHALHNFIQDALFDISIKTVAN